MTATATPNPAPLPVAGVIGCNPSQGDVALATLRHAGVTVELLPDGGLRLLPKAAVTDAVRALVAEHRPAIVKALQTQPAGLLRLWALVGEQVYFVDDDTSLMPVHVGIAVYTASEREVIKRRRWEPHLVKRFHDDRKKLMAAWPGWGWVSESDLDSLCKRLRMLRGDAQEVVNVLCDADIMTGWVPFRYPCWSLLGPMGRAKHREMRRERQQNISREILPGRSAGTRMLVGEEGGDPFGGD